MATSYKKFKPNSFYNEHITAEDLSVENLEMIRDEISRRIEDLCVVPYGTHLKRTFATSRAFDKAYVQIIFENLKEHLNQHMFEKSILASKVLDYDGRIVDKEPIPTQNLERALEIYEQINTIYSAYCNQFFEAVTQLLNHNYVPFSDEEK